MTRSASLARIASVTLLAMAGAACGSTNLPERPTTAARPTVAGSTDGAAVTSSGGMATTGSGDAPGAHSGSSLTGARTRGTTAGGSTTGATSTSGGTTDAATGGTTGDGADSGAATTGGDGGSGEAPDPTSPDGRGFTAERIAIGLQYTEDVQAAFGVVGAEGNPPNDRRVAQAMVDWLNANGGIAGREIVPVYHGTDVTSGTFASQAQAACSTFTEDNEVVAAVSGPVTVGDFLVACMAEASTPLVEINYSLYDQPYWEDYRGILYRPGRMSPDRWAHEYVDGLLDVGYFGDLAVAQNRVGLLRFDRPVYGRVAAAVRERMEARGLTLHDEIEITTPPSVAAFGQMSGELQNAIVRLRSQNIDHVMFLENGAVMTFFFAQQAESQSYRPVYGVSSSDTPSTLAAQAPASQLEDAVGVGWAPAIDLYYPDYLDGQANRDLCAAIMDQAGVTKTYDTRGYYTLSRCSAMLFLKAALDRASELTPAGLLAATESLGTSYQSPFSFGTRLGPGRYDGASGTRLLRYASECACFRYEGPIRPTS